MVQIFVKGFAPFPTVTIDLSEEARLEDVCKEVAQVQGIALDAFYLFSAGDCLSFDHTSNKSHFFREGSTLSMKMPVRGGIDFQHREGGKTGSGGQLSEAQAALERKERLRKLALETIDITKDPYFLRNHLGTFECKLCLTLHPNEVRKSTPRFCDFRLGCAPKSPSPFPT